MHTDPAVWRCGITLSFFVVSVSRPSTLPSQLCHVLPYPGKLSHLLIRSEQDMSSFRMDSNCERVQCILFQSHLPHSMIGSSTSVQCLSTSIASHHICVLAVLTTHLSRSSPRWQVATLFPTAALYLLGLNLWV